MTHQFFSAGKIFQYYAPVTLALFTFITIERSVTTDGGHDRLYGLPLPWITSNLGFTGHYHVYMFSLAGNLLFFFGLTVLLFAGLNKAGLKLKVHWVFQLLSGIIMMYFLLLFYVRVFESDFYFLNNDWYETNSRKLIFDF